MAAALLLAACSPAPTAGPGSPDPVIDGYAVGAERGGLTGDQFHRIEVAARDAWRVSHPHNPSSFAIHHAGVRGDGSVEQGVDDPLTYLVVIDVPGDGRHALVVRCDATFLTGDGACSGRS